MVVNQLDRQLEDQKYTGREFLEKDAGRVKGWTGSHVSENSKEAKSRVRSEGLQPDQQEDEGIWQAGHLTSSSAPVGVKCNQHSCCSAICKLQNISDF